QASARRRKGRATSALSAALPPQVESTSARSAATSRRVKESKLAYQVGDPVTIKGGTFGDVPDDEEVEIGALDTDEPDMIGFVWKDNPLDTEWTNVENVAQLNQSTGWLLV